jgi:hypothetical protein
MAAHAAHCHQLMRELGITRAHIVGHSSSLTHLLHAQNPAAVADGLTGFFARHPIPIHTDRPRPWVCYGIVIPRAPAELTMYA